MGTITAILRMKNLIFNSMKIVNAQEVIFLRRNLKKQQYNGLTIKENKYHILLSVIKKLRL